MAGGVIAGAYGGTGVANTSKTITLGGNLTTSGNFALTLTTTAATSVTLPTTGTLIASGAIINADVNASAAIADTKLATIATAGKVSNSATTATSALGANTIVARDENNNFVAGTITAALTGAASSNVLKAGDTMTGALVVPLGVFGTPSLTFTSDLNTGLFSPGADQVAISTGGTAKFTVGSLDGNPIIENNFPTVRPALDLAFAATKRLDPRVTFVRATSATYVGGDGLVKTAGVNEARFDHDPVTGESLGLLVEEARTNEFTNSNPWAGGSNITWTSSQVSPTGGTESYNMVETAANNIHGLSILGGGFTTDYNRHISVFAKSAGRRYLVFWAALGAYPGADSPECIFDLQSGTVVYLDTGGSGGLFETASITNFGNGWYRCGIYLDPYTLANRNLYILMSNSASPQQSSYTGDGSSGVTLFGLQLEAGAFPTSYIPTSGSTVTRSADVASITGSNFSSWYNPIESSAFVDVIMKNSKGGAGLPAYAFKGSSNYYYGFSRDSVNPYHYVNTSNVNSYLYGTLSSNGNYKACMTWKQNDINSYINSVQNYNTNSVTLFTPDILYLGAVTNTPNILNGTIRKFTYYPKRLTDAQLQALTT